MRKARLSHAAAVAAANWDRPQVGFFLDLVGTCWDQVYVAEIKGIWTQDILDAHREQQLKSQAV